ncbi:MAG: NUDIX hydrolase [bacterium]|nr:NUDIX hydrolase [bacterium]
MIDQNIPTIRIRIAVILVKDNNVLLVKHHKYGREYWLFPGGGLEYGETIESCAKREVKEETNLAIELGDLVLINESIPPDKHRHVLNLFYWGKILGGELTVGKDAVLVAAEFIPLDKLPDLVIYPNVKKELIEIIHGKQPQIISLGNRWE